MGDTYDFAHDGAKSICLMLARQRCLKEGSWLLPRRVEVGGMVGQENDTSKYSGFEI